jgi:hypothetical protein
VVAIGWNIADGDEIAAVQLNPHGADRRFDLVFAGLDAAQVSQSDSDSDNPVAAHSEVAGVIEKDDARSAFLVNRFNQIRAY